MDLETDQFRLIPPGPGIPAPFLLQVTPVTQLQWRQITGDNPSWFSRAGDRHPVERVSLRDIQGFLGLLNVRSPGRRYRLPFEEEWEHAARAGTPVGVGTPAGLEDCAWYRANSGGSTQPVGRKAPNAWGVHDMLGNVWEWVLCAGRGRETDGPGVLRGGAWNSPATLCGYGVRVHETPSNRFACNGLRLVMDVVMTPP